MSEASEESVPADLGKTAAFELNGRSFTVAEVVRAAFFRGELQDCWDDLLLKIAAHERALEGSLEPDGDALQSRADQFRYDRDLITMEETEGWLEKRGLDADGFADHVLRSYWKEALEGKIAPGDARYSINDARTPLLLTELFFTGALNRLMRAFIWRLVSGHQAGPSGEDLGAKIELERSQFFSRFHLRENDLSSWLATAGGDVSWFEEMLLLEAAYARQCESIITPESLTRALRSQRLDLMRFQMEELEFDSMAAAREAILCVREDNLSMEEVASESRYPYFERDFVLDELPHEWRVSLLSTPENGLAGPFAEGDLIRLFRLRKKIEPTIENESVRQRLTQHLEKIHFGELAGAQALKLFL